MVAVIIGGLLFVLEMCVTHGVPHIDRKVLVRAVCLCGTGCLKQVSRVSESIDYFLHRLHLISIVYDYNYSLTILTSMLFDYNYWKEIVDYS